MEASENITEAKTKLYTKVPCGFCMRAKALLEHHGVEYEQIDLTSDIDAQLELAEQTGHTTMPQIFVGDEFIGGFEELALAINNPRIREALGIA